MDMPGLINTLAYNTGQWKSASLYKNKLTEGSLKKVRLTIKK